MAAHRGEFSTRFGFILAAAGAAVGLGNIKRFCNAQSTPDLGHSGFIKTLPDFEYLKLPYFALTHVDTSTTNLLRVLQAITADR